MPDIRLSIIEYVSFISMSKRRHLLVEGSDDKRFFEHIIDCSSPPMNAHDLDIDTVESLVSPEGDMGNRERVEATAFAIEARGGEVALRFSSFVDREFREFYIGENVIKDSLSTTQARGRVVWTRGHSVENYFFSIDALREPFRDFTISDHCRAALLLFEQVFSSALRIACAFSIAGHRLRRLKLMRRTFDWHHFSIVDGSLSFNEARWHKDLQSRQNVDSGSADELLAQARLWLQHDRTKDVELMRWLTHGHIGLSILWSVYAACIASIVIPEERERTASRVLGAQEAVRFNACSTAWARASEVRAREDGPIQALRLIGIG